MSTWKFVKQPHPSLENWQFRVNDQIGDSQGTGFTRFQILKNQLSSMLICNLDFNIVNHTEDIITSMLLTMKQNHKW